MKNNQTNTSHIAKEERTRTDSELELGVLHTTDMLNNVIDEVLTTDFV